METLNVCSINVMESCLSGFSSPRKIEILRERANLRTGSDGKFVFPRDIAFVIKIEGMEGRKRIKASRAFRPSEKPTEVIKSGKSARMFRKSRVEQVFQIITV